MSAFLVAFLAAIGSATWLFAQMQSRSGAGNSRSALTGASVVFVIVLVVVFTLARMTIPH